MGGQLAPEWAVSPTPGICWNGALRSYGSGSLDHCKIKSFTLLVFNIQCVCAIRYVEYNHILPYYPVEHEVRISWQEYTYGLRNTLLLQCAFQLSFFWHFNPFNFFKFISCTIIFPRLNGSPRAKAGAEQASGEQHPPEEEEGVHGPDAAEHYLHRPVGRQLTNITVVVFLC